MYRVLASTVILIGGALLAGRPLLRPVRAAQAAAPVTIPVPANYREWIFLTSGLDMTYNAPGGAGLPADPHSVFDNVFVNPEAYRSFKKSGTWPDNTTLVLENRTGKSDVSINKAGRTQGENVTGLELHKKVHGEWAFYVRAEDGSEKLVPRTASCYACHEQHAAVDTTFVQFYPTLLPVARQKRTLSAAYLHDPETRSDGE